LLDIPVLSVTVGSHAPLHAASRFGFARIRGVFVLLRLFHPREAPLSLRLLSVLI